MKVSRIIYILATLFVAACSGRAKVIPDKDLVNIFHDAFIANAYMTEANINQDSILLYEPIFKRYGYTMNDLQHTLTTINERKSSRISDIMRTEFAKLPESSSIMDCIIAMSTARVGACILVHEDGSLAGVFTHGDFARAYQKDPSCGTQPVRDIMTKNPVYVEADKLAIVAVKTLRDRRIDDLVVLDEDKKPVGLIDTQDLVRLKLI